MAENSKLGATGNFPKGKIREDDEGELRLAVAHDNDKGVVIVDFGKPVVWIGLPADDAVEFANTILKHAKDLVT